MERVFYLVVVVSVVFARPSQDNPAECSVYGADRTECGWLGIDQQTCEKRGCCWDSSDFRAKFCYVKRGQHLLEGQCPVAPSERQECGYYGITRQQCLDRYCCWDDSVPNAKWCFKQPKVYQAGCAVYGNSTIDYGICRYTCYPGMIKVYGIARCGGRICCYFKSTNPVANVSMSV